MTKTEEERAEAIAKRWGPILAALTVAYLFAWASIWSINTLFHLSTPINSNTLTSGALLIMAAKYILHVRWNVKAK